jgi:hypothetical protein
MSSSLFLIVNIADATAFLITVWSNICLISVGRKLLLRKMKYVCVVV